MVNNEYKQPCFFKDNTRNLIKKFVSIDDAYNYLVEKCISEGELIVDERNDSLYQIPFVYLTIDSSIHKQVGDLYHINYPSGCNHNMLKTYTAQLQSGDIGGFVYTYGNRFKEYFGIDQYDNMINKLKSNQYSRRAVGITLDPKRDSVEEEIPCLQLIKLSIFNNKLIMNCVFRSNDISLAFKYNIYALLKLHEKFANDLGIKCGDFNYVGFDAHYRRI